jgi:hypothetical protein
MLLQEERDLGFLYSNRSLEFIMLLQEERDLDFCTLTDL